MKQKYLIALAFGVSTLSPLGAASDNYEANYINANNNIKATIPENWNGVLLVYSHGYQAQLQPPEDAPERYRDILLENGYGLLGSSYSQAGWAIEQAVPDQNLAIVDFVSKRGKPRITIAWGFSMGGLVSTALAEQSPSSIDGSLSVCSSMGGALGMMNTALDGAFAFKTLLAPNSEIELVNIQNDMLNSRRVTEVLNSAKETPQGQARIALAGVLAGIPNWTDPQSPEPSESDYVAQANQIAKAFPIGVFLPRAEQESRAGGNFSWNIGVDYKSQLRKSGRLQMVRALYRRAGLNLDDDLKILNNSPRISANEVAVEYMRNNYTPNMRPQVPILAVQHIGDGATSPSFQSDYYLKARQNGGSRLVRSYFFRQAGHCNISSENILSSVRIIQNRIETGRWGDNPKSFISNNNFTMPRSCVRGGKCE